MRNLNFCLDAELAGDFENMVFSIAKAHAKPVHAPEVSGNHFIGMPFFGFGSRAIHINSGIEVSTGKVSYNIDFIDLPRAENFVSSVIDAYNSLRHSYSPEKFRQVVAIS
ncbi:hypothetical protein HY483_01620 [Candidatus Woesearchaeota archaeon]|nr:hypothetical protein [Candidatus Woesearchaeota archaeon]